jgi:hypothetical protein
VATSTFASTPAKTHRSGTKHRFSSPTSPKDRIAEMFLRAAEALDPAIRSFVVARLLEFAVTSAASSGNESSV